MSDLGVIGSMDFSVFRACSGPVDHAVLVMTAVGDSPSAPPSAVTPTPASENVVFVSLEQIENPPCISGADSSTEETPLPIPSLPSPLIPLPQIKTEPDEPVVIASSPERDIRPTTPPTSSSRRENHRLKRENLSYLRQVQFWADTVKTLGNEYTRPPSDLEQAARRKLVRITPRTVVFIATAAAIYSLGHGLCTFTAVLRSTQPSTLSGTVK